MIDKFIIKIDYSTLFSSSLCFGFVVVVVLLLVWLLSRIINLLCFVLFSHFNALSPSTYFPVLYLSIQIYIYAYIFN